MIFQKTKAPARNADPRRMATLSSFLDHIGISLGLSWGRVGIILGSFWGHLGIILASFWGHDGIIIGSFWCHVGILLGPYGVMLGSFWHHAGTNEFHPKCCGADFGSRIKISGNLGKTTRISISIRSTGLRLQVGGWRQWAKPLR